MPRDRSCLEIPRIKLQSLSIIANGSIEILFFCIHCPKVVIRLGEVRMRGSQFPQDLNRSLKLLVLRVGDAECQLIRRFSRIQTNGLLCIENSSGKVVLGAGDMGKIVIPESKTRANPDRSFKLLASRYQFA